MKTAMISGITGQDGSYLLDLLLEKNYKVIGLHRRSSINNFDRIQHQFKNSQFILEEFDITDPALVSILINNYQPDEFYNLAAQSHVATSFKQPSTTFDINTTGVINILEAIKNYSSQTRFYQASTSEMFGCSYSIDNDKNKFQDENTKFSPQSPYAVAKLASHRLTQIYRDAYNIFSCSGILFNHESPRRGENFVTRKITKYIGDLINKRTNDKLKLGNIYSSRDWGHAKDYVYAMFLMLQSNKPDDYVISSETTHSVADFAQRAFSIVGLDYKEHIIIDEDLYRPAEVEFLKGLSTKAHQELNWCPKISFDQLIQDMVQYDINNKTYA